MTDPWLRLSDGEFFLLWDAADFGEPPAVLNLRHIGRTRAERAQYAEEACADLLERDLGTIKEPAAELTDVLRAIGHRDLTLSLAVEWAEGRFNAVAARGPEGAAIAVAVNDSVSARTLRPAGLADAITDELDPVPAGPGVTANVAWADYLRACREGERDGTDGFVWVLRETGMRVPEARTIARAVAERTGTGQLDIAPRTGRSHDTINWVDTPEGRYILRRRDNWLSVIPADPAKLNQLITESLPR